MPKHKEMLRTKEIKVGKKGKPEGPLTENEYLAAGVDFEEAGEKWRAGDATKSLRFFVKAIESYDAGLQKFPQSFELAYNKARLQFEVAQQPRLLSHLPTPLIDLLRLALDSHRFALHIDQDSPDLLFNTAQVLTSIAEIRAEGGTSSEAIRDEALRLLHEALELFQRCLNVQEFGFTRAQENAAQHADLISEANEADTGATGGPASDASEEEVWASVEEPITRGTLLDTAVAQLNTLTAICSLGSLANHNDLAWMKEYYRKTLQQKIDSYIDSSGQEYEAALARAKFIAAISDAAFRSGRLDIPTYERELNSAFSHQDLDLTNDPEGLCDRADAYLAFSASVQLSLQHAQPDEIASFAVIVWKHITKAVESLSAASKLPAAQHLPRIHLRRGDCELLRLGLAEAPLKYDLAIKNATTLMRNAEIYFRGASKFAKAEGAAEEQSEAEAKEAFVALLNGDATKLSTLVEFRRQSAQAVFEDMVDEGLLGNRLSVQISDSLGILERKT